jgi:hypothetical protein
VDRTSAESDREIATYETDRFESAMLAFAIARAVRGVPEQNAKIPKRSVSTVSLYALWWP